MAKSSEERNKRHEILKVKLKEDPFLTDAELANYLSVSVPTIRLDRMYLGIPELRERVLNLASDGKIGNEDNIVWFGDLVDLKKGICGISVLTTGKKMCFDNTNVVRGSFIYCMAESLAVDIAGAPYALIGVANIKYKIPVKAGSKLVARGELKIKRDNGSIVWIKIYMEQTEVFSGKFILNIIN